MAHREYLPTTPGTQIAFEAQWGPKRHWWNRRRNWMGETPNAEHERRIVALEEHIKSLEERYSELENKYNRANAVKVPLPTLETGSKTTDAS